MRLRKVINMFGGPCTGKSVTAADVFVHLKKQHINIELIDEYAKQLTYDKRFNILQNDQLYVLAKQHRKQYRVRNHVDYAVTDSPLILGCIYFDAEYNGCAFDNFRNMAFDVFNRYNNVNIFLIRNDEFEYQSEGRNQSLNEACGIDNEVLQFLIEYNIPHYKVVVGDTAMEQISEILSEEGIKWGI